jgi:hypothetical protein
MVGILIAVSPLTSHASLKTLSGNLELTEPHILEWVKSKQHHYPELEWLLDKEVQATQEAKAQQYAHSWSMQLAGAHHIEFERTLLSMLLLHVILDGSEEAYQWFVKPQPLKGRLSYVSFKELHQFATNVIQGDPTKRQALETNLLLGDMGKTRVARTIAKKHGIIEPDHDLFLDACLAKCPEIFPSFMALPEAAQSVLKEGAGLVHFGHVAHVEGGPEILKKLKRSKILEKNAKAFDFEILTHICDVSAARGHVDNQGSKVLDENTFRTLQAVRAAILSLATKTEAEALQEYLSIRSQWLGLEGEEQHVLARVAAMLRLFTPEEGRALTEGFNALSPEKQALIKAQFNPLIDRNEKTPTYMPAVLVNLLDQYQQQGLTRAEAIQATIQKGLVFIVDILHTYRLNKASIPYSAGLTLNFNTLAGQVRDNPALLNQAAWFIDEQGHIMIRP